VDEDIHITETDIYKHRPREKRGANTGGVTMTNEGADIQLGYVGMFWSI
jgi:hypothetical protein